MRASWHMRGCAIGLALALGLAACGGGGGDATGPNGGTTGGTSTSASAITAVSGGGQIGTPGTALASPLTVKVTTAVADYSQPEFDAAFVLNKPQPKAKGWAVGGAVDRSHTLTLTPDTAVKVAKGSKLVVTIEQTTTLTYFVYDEVNRCRDTSSLLNAAPAMGTNVVHVGHVDYPATCAVLGSLNPAEAAIYKPTLGAPPRYVARVAASQWVALP